MVRRPYCLLVSDLTPERPSFNLPSGNSSLFSANAHHQRPEEQRLEAVWSELLIADSFLHFFHTALLSRPA